MTSISVGLVALLVLSGCTSAMQDSYDERAIAECRELPTPNERLACERAAIDRKILRRAEDKGDS
jgi:hypothetical protein